MPGLDAMRHTADPALLRCLELAHQSLWSSHRPCMMCQAAGEFTGVDAVIFIAPDPSDDDLGEDPDGIALMPQHIEIRCEPAQRARYRRS